MEPKNNLTYKDNTHYFHLTPTERYIGLVEIAKRFEAKFVIHDEIIRNI